LNRYRFLATLLFASATFAAAPDVHKVNGSIVVAAGQPLGDLSTVNGAINVEDKAMIEDARTVNGRIVLGAATTARSLKTVNGSISVGPGSNVAGAVTTVNGAVVLEQSAHILGNVANVNGQIRLDAAEVGSGIETVTGDIAIGAHSSVEGGIWVKKKCYGGVWQWFTLSHCEPSLVVVGPDAIVQGTLRFEHEVKLYVSDRARIGPVEGAKAIVYTGDRPPA
jgi:DUF4097 and DUF4098 domain-containing protein YvlB